MERLGGWKEPSRHVLTFVLDPNTTADGGIVPLELFAIATARRPRQRR